MINAEQQLSELDFEAADAVLAGRNGAATNATPSRDQLRQFYASLHAQYGADKFALRFGLRSPRTIPEKLEFLFYSQQIGEDEYQSLFQEHVNRPIDGTMLGQFFADHEAALRSYSDGLQKISRIATTLHIQNDWRGQERKVDTTLSKLDNKFELYAEELVTVGDFLTQVQLDRHELIKSGNLSADTAHGIATHAFLQACKAWASCKEVAKRSRTDPRYLYATTASTLFFKTWIESGALPKPNELAALMRVERAKAMSALSKAKQMKQASNRNPSRTVHPVRFDDLGGEHFERLVFAYHLHTSKWKTLEWYGQTGSDHGRDIWGERLNGKTLCTQCVNRKTTTLAKIAGDLDKIIQSKGGIPDAVLMVCTSKVSAKLRDAVKAHAQNLGIADCQIWAGAEFEERVRRDAESLLKRFLGGEIFPDDPKQLSYFVCGIINPDRQAVEQIVAVFKRPAFETPFQLESSLPAFRQAIADTIQVLNTGIWQTRDGKEIGRIPSRHQVINLKVRASLAVIVKNLADMRGQFDNFIRQGDIRPCNCNQPDCPVFFLSEKASDMMNTIRATILSRVGGLRELLD